MESVVALDAAIVGRTRHVYFQRRLKSALEQTERHVQFSAEQDGRFVGFIKARKQLGEFGRAEPAMLLEAIAVAPDKKGQGIGSALLARLETEAKRMGVPAIRTAASWRDHEIMRFFDTAGFEVSRNIVLDCPVRQEPVTAHEGDKVLAPAHRTRFSATEVDYSPVAGNDFEALARDKFDVRALKAIGVPYSDQDIAAAQAAIAGHTEMDAMVAYLQGLKFRGEAAATQGAQP